jgi:hypothetical protein
MSPLRPPGTPRRSGVWPRCQRRAGHSHRTVDRRDRSAREPYCEIESKHDRARAIGTGINAAAGCGRGGRRSAAGPATSGRGTAPARRQDHRASSRTSPPRGDRALAGNAICVVRLPPSQSGPVNHRYTSLDEAIARIGVGAAAHGVRIVVSRSSWDALSPAKRAAYRAQCDERGVTLCTDDRISRHFVELAVDGEPPLSSERRV